MQAHATPDKIKGALVYNDEDALDTGMQKVQPLPFLGEHIHCEVINFIVLCMVAHRRGDSQIRSGD